MNDEDFYDEDAVHHAEEQTHNYVHGKLEGDSNGDSCETKTSATSTMAEFEVKALEEKFRSLGYHEGYEETCDERLQDGFEDGFRNVYAGSQSLALNVGQQYMSDMLHRLNHEGKEHAGSVSNDLSAASKESRTKAEGDVKKFVKGVLAQPIQFCGEEKGDKGETATSIE